jgi:hypothetical protein
MLGYQYRLMFPHLNAVKDVVLRGQKKPTMIWQLNWEGLDKLVEHVAPIKTIFEDQQILQDVNNYYFALSQNHLREIHNFSRSTLDTICCRSNTYDGSTLFEAVHEVAEVMLMTAFKLLGDCLYDPERNYYNRSYDKIIAPHLMAWRFWVFQAGEGMIRSFAKIKELEDRMSCIMERDDEEEQDNSKYDYAYWHQVKRTLLQTESVVWPYERLQWERTLRSQPATGASEPCCPPKEPEFVPLRGGRKYDAVVADQVGEPGPIMSREMYEELKKESAILGERVQHLE